MGGTEVLIALAATQIGAGIAGGAKQAEAAELEAQGIELQAQQDIEQINRELDEALSMQSAIFGAQGRVEGVGSTKAVKEGDIKQAKKDIAAVEAGAELGAAASRKAGKAARFGSIAGGLIGGGSSLSQIK